MWMRTLKALAFLLICVSIGSNFGKLHFVIELSSHFRAHFAAVLLLLTVLFALIRQAKWAVISLFAVSINLVEIVPWYVSGNEWDESAAGDSFEVLLSNVQRGNGDYGGLAGLVSEEQPDIVGLLEVDARWLENLESLRRQYEYSYEYARDDLFGLALYSKLRIAAAEVVRFGDTATPSIVATVESGDDVFTLLLAHAPLPLGRASSARRNSQLQRMAQYIGSSDKPVLLVADLNTTMWSTYYKDFERDAGMSNARAGYGIGATFPSLPAIGIPIDHILVTPPSLVGEFRVHRNIGSDHLPISANVRITPRS